jgi:hypothetical protein
MDPCVSLRTGSAWQVRMRAQQTHVLVMVRFEERRAVLSSVIVMNERECVRAMIDRTREFERMIGWGTKAKGPE